MHLITANHSSVTIILDSPQSEQLSSLVSLLLENPFNYEYLLIYHCSSLGVYCRWWVLNCPFAYRRCLETVVYPILHCNVVFCLWNPQLIKHMTSWSGPSQASPSQASPSQASPSWGLHASRITMRITQFVPATRIVTVLMTQVTVVTTKIGVAVLLEWGFASQVSIFV